MIFNSTNLPSRMIPYKVKELEVDLFKPRQITLMSKAVMLDSMEPAIEAMGQVIKEFDINQLTVGDFFYLMAWQRLNCFKRKPVHAEWTCPGAVFKAAGSFEVYSPRDIDELVTRWDNASEEERKSLTDPESIALEGDVCSHTNYAQVTLEDFTVIFLDEDVQLDPDLDFPRVATLSDFITMQRDPDVGMIADSVQWIKHRGDMRMRLNKLLDCEDTELMEKASEACQNIQHGISRTISKPCAKCGHKHTLTFVVDPKAFFL